MRMPELIIDPDLECLIPQLSADEIDLLEESILQEGCRDAICVWEQTILDGHNRYRICSKHGLPFKVVNLPIQSKDEAIVWICINQMGRRNISDETRHYLIGKRYEAEKRIGLKNPSGRNQYSVQNEDAPTLEEHPQSRVRDRYTSVKLGKEYGLGHHTIEKYGRYSRDIDVIEKAAPELSSRILNGDLYVSMENVNEIAQLTGKQIQAVSDSILPSNKVHIQHEQIIDCLGRIEARQRPVRQDTSRDIPTVLTQTVKDTPKYDPDSEISSLTLTMPTWRASINRTLEAANMALITSNARMALKQELLQLRNVIESILRSI